MNQKTVMLRCEDGMEAVVFTKYIFKDEIDYDMSFEDFATQNQLPPEITAETTQAEALEIMQADHTGHNHE